MEYSSTMNARLPDSVISKVVDGEQTSSLLDAAAAYLARMESLYDQVEDDDDDDDIDNDKREDAAVKELIDSSDNIDDEDDSADDDACEDERFTMGLDDETGPAENTDSASRMSEEIQNRNPSSDVNADVGGRSVQINANAEEGQHSRSSSTISNSKSAKKHGDFKCSDGVVDGEPTTAASSSSNPKTHMMDMDDSISFHIGDDDDGFRLSSSIHESDISVTASETSSMNDEYEESDIDIDGVNVTDFIGRGGEEEDPRGEERGVTAEERSVVDHEHYNDDDGDKNESVLPFPTTYDTLDDVHDDDVDVEENFVLKEVALEEILFDPTTGDGEALEIPAPPPTHSPSPMSSIDGNDVHDSTVDTIIHSALVSAENRNLDDDVEASVLSLSSHRTHDDAVMTPPRSLSAHDYDAEMTPYTNNIDDDASHHDYVSTTLKRMLQNQESVLTRFMSSVDGITSTPGRIANQYQEEIMSEYDVDEDVHLLVDDVGDDIGSDYDLFLTVKRRLLPDDGNDSLDLDRKPTTWAKTRRLDDTSLLLDIGRSATETPSESVIDLVSPLGKITAPMMPAPPLPAFGNKSSQEESSSTVKIAGGGEEDETKHHAVIDKELLCASSLADENDDEEDEDDGFVPSSMKQLFRDADSILLDILASPLPGLTMNGRENNIDDRFSEDDIKPCTPLMSVTLHADRQVRTAVDNSVLNDTYDTAFCSLGAIERATDEYFVKKVRNDVNSTTPRRSLDSQSFRGNNYIDAPDIRNNRSGTWADRATIQRNPTCNIARITNGNGNSSTLATALIEYEEQIVDYDITRTPYKAFTSSCFHAAEADTKAKLKTEGLESQILADETDTARLVAERVEHAEIGPELETARLKSARLKHERIEAEVEAEDKHCEQERLSADAKAAKLEEERLEREKVAAVLDATRFEAERFDQKRLFAEAEAAKLEARLEQEKLSAMAEAVKSEEERLEREKVAAEADAVRFDAERYEQERLAAEIDAERVEARHFEQESLVSEAKAAREEVRQFDEETLVEVDAIRFKTECFEQERLASEFEEVKLKEERLERAVKSEEELLKPKKLAAEVDVARIEAERFEQERLAAEAEVSTLDTENFDRERLVSEAEAAGEETDHSDQERLAVEADVARVDSEAEVARDEAERFDQGRLGADVEMLMIDADRLERERLAAVNDAVIFEAKQQQRQRIMDDKETSRFSERLAAKAEAARVEAERFDSERIQQEKLAAVAEAERLENERRSIAAEVGKARLEVERLERHRIADLAEAAKSGDGRLEQKKSAAELVMARLEIERLEQGIMEAASKEAKRLVQGGLTDFESDSRPSSASTEKSNLGENFLNESMFMPNLSIDIDTSPTGIFTAVVPIPAMSEDESEGNHDDDDDEAFFPSPVRRASVASKTPRTEALFKDIDKIVHKNDMALVTKQVTNQGANSQEISNHSSCKEAKKHQKGSIITKRHPLSSAQQPNHKTAPLRSPSSSMKPVKMTTKAAAMTKSEGKENSDDKLIAKEEQPIKTKQPIDITLSRSMKQSSVLMTSTRCQSQTNISSERNPTNPTPPRLPTAKKTADVARLERLARPRVRQSMIPATPLRQATEKAVDVARPQRLAQPKVRHSMIPLPNPEFVGNTKKKQKRADGPPSFLSRPVLASHMVKSTAELEREEMERVKPFKAQRILGSSAEVKSRYKSSMPRPPASMQAAAPSNRKPPASARSFPCRVYELTPKREQVSTFGEQIEHYLNHSLRDSAPSPRDRAPGPKKLSTSTHNPPSFLRRQTLSHSVKAKAKSSEEIELEECRKQFRARSICIDYGRPPIRQTPALQTNTPQQVRQCMLTTPSPFRLHIGCSRPPAPSTDELELAKQFRALPLPGPSTRTMHGHAEMSRLGRERPNTEGSDFRFKAKPVPKSTYVAKEIITLGSPIITQPKSPGLALSRRAEARKLFDTHLHEKGVMQAEMKEMKELQQKEMEEAEIQRKRRSYADDGGFCFKATSISIEYI